MYILKLFMGNRIRFILPIRKSKYVVFSCRKGGRIYLKKHVSLNENVHLSVTQNAILEIGNYSGVGDNSVIVAREKIIIGDNVMIGPNVCVYDHDHVYKTDDIMREVGYTSSPVIIENNVWLGAGVIVLKGVTIGSGSVIAAGTVVNKSIPANSVVYREGKLIIKEKFR